MPMLRELVEKYSIQFKLTEYQPYAGAVQTVAIGFDLRK